MISQLLKNRLIKSAAMSGSSDCGGIIKINSRPLDSSELKRLDKVEKESITFQGATVKGKGNERVATRIIINHSEILLEYWERRNDNSISCLLNPF